MNGFVKFAESHGVEDFFSSPVVKAIRSTGRLVKSSSQPVVIFRELNEKDASAVADVAEALGGKVIPSTPYEPL
jgi:hypothetical protein